MGLNCLVTGGLGFIGSHVVDKLVADGHEVTVIDNLSTGKRDNVDTSKIKQLIIADITKPWNWDEIGKFDAVFHLAALARVQPSIKDPITHHYANVDGTLQVLEYCRNNNAKLIFSSSSSVYSGDSVPMNESDKLYPKSPYALQKQICEQYIRLYGELYDLNYVILRYFSVYGERQPLEGAYRTVIGIFLQQYKDGLPLTITNDGEQRRDFTYVKDVAEANIKALLWPDCTLNIGAGRNYSVNEVADLFGGAREYIGDVPGEARETYANNALARYHGWGPTVDLDDWLKGQLNA